MLLLTCDQSCGGHGPGGILEWERATYALEGVGSVDCVVEEDLQKLFVFDDGLNVKVEELPTTSSGTGHAVWDASIALALLLRSSESSILELGCGCALPSATQRARGCGRVLATDSRREIVEMLTSRGVNAKVMEWSEPFDDRFDCVIGAEIVYTATAIPSLVRTISSLAPRRVMLVSLARRKPLLETLARRLDPRYKFYFTPLVLKGTSKTSVSGRVLVDDYDRVELVLLTLQPGPDFCR